MIQHSGTPQSPAQISDLLGYGGPPPGRIRGLSRLRRLHVIHFNGTLF